VEVLGQMDLHTYLIKLKDWFSNQISKTEDIERQNPEKWWDRIQELKSDLIENKEMAQQMIDGITDQSVGLKSDERRNLEAQIKILEQNVTDNQRRIALLEEEISEKNGRIEEITNNLDKTQNRLEKIENALKTGQIAFEFEKDLATYIYPEGKKFGSRQIFTRMKEWLRKVEGTDEGDVPNERWSALQKEFSWSEKHEKVFEKLLKSRIPFAHPAIDLDVAQSQIPKNFDDEEKKCIEDILHIIERVNKLMEL
jgi:hypothetical protein